MFRATIPLVTRRSAIEAVNRAMAEKHLSAAELARTAAVDPGTVGDFLNGTRWPQLATRGRIEQALGWRPGTIALIADGTSGDDLDQAPVGPTSEDVERVMLDLPAEVTKGMTPVEREEFIAALKLRAYEKAAEIRRRLDQG